MKKRNVALWAAMCLVALLVITSVLLLVYPMLFLGVLERSVQSVSGLDTRAEQLAIDLSPPRISIEGLSVSNPTKTLDRPLLTTGRVEVTVNLSQWWNDSPTWWSATVDDARLYVGTTTEHGNLWEVRKQPAVQDSGASTSETMSSPMSPPKSSPMSPPKAPPEARTGATGSEATKTESGALSDIAFQFSTLRAENIVIERIADERTSRFGFQEISLSKDSDERLNITVDGHFEEQPLTATGTLALPSSERAREVDFRATLPGGQLWVKGVVGHDGLVPGAADFSINIEEFEGISELLGDDYGYLAPVDLSGTLAAPRKNQWTFTSEGRVAELKLQIATSLNSLTSDFSLETLEAEYGRSSLQANGSINNRSRAVRLEINSPLVMLNEIQTLADQRVESDNKPTDAASGKFFEELAGWQLDVSASVAAIGYGSNRVEGLDLRISSEGKDSELRVVGSAQKIASLARAKNEQQEQAAPQSVTQDSAMPMNARESAWEIVEPVEFDAALALVANVQDRRPFFASISTSDAGASISGALAGDEFLPRRATASLTLDSLSALKSPGFDKNRLSSLFPLGAEMSANAPSARRTAGFADITSLEFSSLKLTIADDELNGDATVSWEQSPVTVSGTLHSPYVDINRFRTTPSPHDATAEEPPSSTGDELFSNAPLDWSWLNAAILDLDLSIGELVFNQTRFKNVQLAVAQSGGRFSIEPLRADLSQGGIRGGLSVNRWSPAPAIDADTTDGSGNTDRSGGRIDSRLIVTQLAPADLGRESAGLIDGGSTDILVKLSSQGISAQDLADNLNGEIALEVQKADIRNNIIELVGSDLLLQTINLINPFTQKNDNTELECAAAYFRATDGVLVSPDQLVMETGRMKIRGGGEINLRTEELQIDFVPRARKGLGISLSSLASVVRLGGTLKNPKPTADVGGILSAGASIGAAISTGGLSLLAEGLFDRARAAGGTACGKIFDKLPDAEIPQAIQPEQQAGL